ncbi:MAG: Rv2175c family DNA-binding protein [Microbacteriaceae bacterium]
MTETSQQEWLTVPEIAEKLEKTVSQVRRLLEDRALLARRIDGVLKVPADFFSGTDPLSELKGTISVLTDAAFTDDEALNWLLNPEDSLGVSPIDALKAGRKAEVRRVAQALGF